MPGYSLSLKKWGLKGRLLQGASLVFEENQVKKALAAFAKFLTREHDYKAARQGQFVYTNGLVRIP